MRIIGALLLAVLLLLTWYALVDYAPALVRQTLPASVTYKEFIAEPNLSQYFPYFLLMVAASVAGYVAARYRE
jgi:uncharacterized membrane protein YkvI